MSTDLGDIDTEISAVGTSGTDTSDALTKADTAMADIDLIPDNTAGGRVSAFTYGSPFDGAAPGSTISSTFPDDLGDSTDAGTKVYNAYVEVEATKDEINSIALLADTFSGSISTFQGAVGGVRDTIDGFATLL